MSELNRRDFLGLGTVATAGLAAGCAPAADQASVTPDLIVVNGNVLTQDDANPSAEAFAIKDGRFVAVGSTADVQKNVDVAVHSDGSFVAVWDSLLDDGGLEITESVVITDSGYESLANVEQRLLVK